MQPPNIALEIAVRCGECGVANHWTGLASTGPITLPVTVPGDTDRCENKKCRAPLTYDRERAFIREMPLLVRPSLGDLNSR